MGERDVTELVIDANTSGADQYSQAMDRVAGSSEKGMTSATGVALAIAGVGVAVVGAMAGLRGFYDYVGSQNKLLVDMANNAELAGLSTREFQQTLYAARTAGISEKDFVSGLDRITADLTAASRGVTEFGKLFEANGLSIRNASGNMKSAQEAVADLAGMMQNASPQVQQGIARIVGVSKDWIPFLKQGADAIEETKKSAEALGVIIDDDVIQQAKVFDREWRTAVAAWDLQFKASMNSILPLLVQLANLAAKVIDSVGAVSSEWMRLTTPDDQKTKAQLDQQISQVMELRDLVERADNEFQKFKARNMRSMLGLPEDADLKAIDAYVEKLRGLYNQQPARVAITGGTTVLPPTGGSQKDALEKEIDTIEKHIARFKADAEAVGQGIGVREQLRAEAGLYAAAERAGIKNTEDYAEQFYKLSQRIGDAALALERAKTAQAIKFGADTGFLSQQDLQIANQLKGQYVDVGEAMNSAEARALRFNAALREISGAVENNLVSGLTDIAMGTKSVSQGFSDMSLAVVRALEQMLIKITIVEPLMRGMQSLMGGSTGGGAGAALPGMSNFIGPVASAKGNVFDSGNVVPFARGGVVGSNSMVPMAQMGEAGPEAIIPLRRGADGRLGVGGPAGSAGRAPQVTINNYTDAQAQTSSEPNGDVTITLRKMVNGILVDSIANGDGGRAIENKYGVKQFAGA